MNKEHTELLKSLCSTFRKYNSINPADYENYNVKRGLRNPDGTGVMAGVTLIGNVHGYVVSEGERTAVEGKLFYRGIDVEELITGFVAENRFGFEEVIYLLLFGILPDEAALKQFCGLLAELRNLPPHFTEDMIIKAPSRDIMNKLGRSVLALYSYDATPDDTSLENVLRQSLELIARFPTIAAHAYHVKRHYFDNGSMHIHFPEPSLSTAQNFLRTIRPDNRYSEEEARLLDLCLVLHAEHGGGNNSAFACRVLSSSGTDTYSAISAAVGSLKGPRHGGANIKVMEMMDDIAENVSDWSDDGEILEYLRKILMREAGDGSGLIYGMGHAVYTISDPRAIVLKKDARRLAEKKGMLDELLLIEAVERLAPEAFARFKGDGKLICANVDLYSGFVYRMLGIPPELYTPIFAISRVVGWASHRIEEITSGGRIIRPAYKSVAPARPFVPLRERQG